MKSKHSTVVEHIQAMHKQFKNMVFDVGGVLLNWNPYHVVENFCNDPEMQQCFLDGLFFHADWHDFDRGTILEADLIQNAAIRINETPESVHTLIRQAKEYLTPKAEVLSILEERHQLGMASYCLSNMPAEFYGHLIKTYDFFDLFQGIVISSKLKTTKPEKEIYSHLMETFSLNPEETLFVDDSRGNIKAAQLLGITSIYFNQAA